MSLTLVSAPSVEPITVAEAVNHLRLDSNVESATLERLIEAARLSAEEYTRRAFITQTWDWRLDAFPRCASWEIPKAPLQSITSIKYIDDTGTEQTWSSSSYDVSVAAGPHALPGRVALAYGISYPSTRYQIDAVTVRFVAGYGVASAVPAAIKQAMLLLIAEMFERREEVTIGTIQSPNMMSAARLLGPFRLLEAS